MQALSLFLPRWPWDTRPRSPCPYRSPQSLAFYQLLRPLVAILLNMFNHIDIDKPFHSEDHALASHSMTMEKDRELISPYLETTSCRRRRPTNLVFCHDIGDSWATIGIAWLFQRDLDFMQKNTRFKELDLDEERRPVPVFDTVTALIDVGANGSPRDVFLAHQCVEPVVRANKSDMDYMNYLSLLVDLDNALDNSRPKEISLDTLANHNILLFHHEIVGSRQLEIAPKSVIELFANTTRTLLADGAKPLVDIWLPWLSPLSYFNFGRHPGKHK